MPSSRFAAKGLLCPVLMELRALAARLSGGLPLLLVLVALLAAARPAHAQTSYISSRSGGNNPLSSIPDPAGGVIQGDFDSDGDVDVLAFDDENYDSFTFYANDGSGSFAPVTGAENPFSNLVANDLFYRPKNTYVADFDNDGDVDVWDFEGSNSGDGTSLYLENDNGTYTSSQSGGNNPLSNVPDPGEGVIVGDFDSDGDVDVLAFDDENYNSFTFYANNGSGGFSATTGADNPFSTLSASDLFFSSHYTYVADFDNDGDVDIWDYRGSNGGDGASIYLENDEGTHTSSLSGGNNPLSSIPDPEVGVIQGDFDADGDIDVLAFDDENYDSFTFYANNGSGGFFATTGAENLFRTLSADDLFWDSDGTYVADFDNDSVVEIWDYEGENTADGTSIYLNGLFRLHVDAATGDDSNDGESWNQAFATLTKALDAARARDTIWVAEGVYRPDDGPGVTGGDPSATFTLTGAQDGLALYGGFEHGDAFADRDPDAHPVVLSGDIDGNDATNADGVTETTGDIAGTNSTRVLHLDGTTGGGLTRATVLDGLTVTGGQANGAGIESGGGLLCDGAGSGNECSPTLARVWFAGNEADRGGALALDGSSGGVSSPTLVNVVLTNNTAQSGGALYVTGANGGTADPVIANAALTNNTATDGGALFVNANTDGTSRLSLVQATMQGNSATNQGGAVYVTGTGTQSTADPTLTNIVLWGNSASSGGDQMAVTGAGALPTVSHTLLAGGLEAVVMSDSAFVIDGGNNLDADPQFVNAADPDGVDDTFTTADDGLRVTLSSPALDTGDGTALPADMADLDDDDTSESLPIDLTGAPRVQDGTVDLGAYEGGTPALAIDAFAPSAAAPGETVKITGTRLTNTSSVTISGTDAPFTVESSTEVTVTVPDGASTGPIELTVDGQTVSGPSDLTVVDPPYGPETALSFDGATDGSGAYVEAPTDVLDTTAPFTVEAWIRWDGSQGFRAFFSKPDGSQSSGVALVVFDGELRAGVDVGGATRQVSLTSTPANEWIHVATTYDGTEQALYVNGAQVDASSYGSEAFTAPSNEPVFIGREFAPGFLDDRTFPGQIDQVRTWSAALSQEQIRARMHQTIESDDAASDDLVASYRFDVGTGTTAYDYAGSLPGTLQNGAAWQSFSGANVGQEQAVATDAQSASVGPSNATLIATNVSSGDTVQVYRYGAADGPARTTSDDGDDLSGVYPPDRANLTWGLATPDGSTPTADLTLRYGGVQGLTGTVDLLRRAAPGTPWTRATAWTHDAANQQFTFSGAMPTGEYAVTTRPPIHVDAANGDDANPGTRWDQPFATLQKALDVATGADEIWVAAGTYYPDDGPGVTDDDRNASFTVTGNQDGLTLYGGFAGTETNLSDRDLSARNETILSGDIDQDDALSGNSYHVLVFDGGNGIDIGQNVGADVTTATVLNGVTVTGGNANGGRPNDSGGGLLCDAGGSGNVCSPTVANVVFAGNVASSRGGAIHNRALGGESSPPIINSLFIDNVAERGGAIHNEGRTGTSSPTITNSTFINNATDQDGSGYGGAMYNFGGNGTSSPTITNSIFYGNRSPTGSQIRNFGSGVALTLSHTLTEGGAGGIANSGGASVIYLDADGTEGTGFAGSSNLDADPLFVDASAPAGLDDTFGTFDDGLVLQPGSPALDAGDDSAIPNGLATDLIGSDRIQDSDDDGTATVSLGAYEAGGLALTTELQLRGQEGTGNDTGWRILSVPYTNATAGDLRLTHANGTTVPRLASDVVQRWDDTAGNAPITGGYVPATASTPLDSGQGVLLYIADDATVPVTFPDGVTVSVNQPASTLQAPDPVTVDGLARSAQWHLLGNPHPTSYTLNALTSGGQSLPAAGFNATVQIYDATQQAWTLVDLSSASVAPWQGFFVERTAIGDPAGPTSITFPADGRSTGAPFVGTQAADPYTAQDARLGLRLTVTTEAASPDTLAQDDAIGLRFHAAASPDWDAWDASKMDPLADTYATLAPIGTVRDGSRRRKAVESRPWLTPSDAPVEVPVRLQATSDLSGQTATIALRRTTLPADWTVILTDTRGTATPDDDQRVELGPHHDAYTFTMPDAPGDVDRFQLTVDPSGAPLPVELASFTGTADGESVRLKWQTASETNNTGFEVQRAVAQAARQDTSTAASTTWESVGFVDGAGTTTEPQTYRFRDDDLPFAAEHVTYRLKQIDTDGTATRTEPVTIARPAVTELQLRKTFPNPARERVTVQFAVPETYDVETARVRLQLYDLLGRQVRTVVSDGTRGRSELHLDVGRLAAGMYILRLQASDQTRTRRVMVVH